MVFTPRLRALHAPYVIRPVCLPRPENPAIIQRVADTRIVSVKAGHETGSVPKVEMDPEWEQEIASYKANEESASRLSSAAKLRTLVADKDVKFATICCNTASGYPYGALTQFAADDGGRILCCLTNMSRQTGELKKDSRASVVISEGGFNNMNGSRCTITGDFKLVPEEDISSCREIFLSKHPEAAWVDFGDFNFMRMDNVVSCNYIQGFGRAGKITPKAYLEATPDHIARFSRPICKHMNDDHGDATAAIVKNVSGLTAKSAELKAVDSLGMDVLVVPERSPDLTVQVRIAYSSPAEDRKDVKDRIVELTKAAAVTA